MSDTGESILIVRETEDAKYRQCLLELHKVLIQLKNILPEGYKIGAGVSDNDSFFHSIAQGLNELRTEGLITCDYPLDVVTLREDCANYADYAKDKILKDSERGGYFIAMTDPSGPVQCQETKSNIRDDNETFKAYVENIKSTSKKVFCMDRQPFGAILGRPEVEGEIVCKKYGVKMKVFKLTEEKVGELHVITNEIGTGRSVIYVSNFQNHFIPLLRDIKKDVEMNEYATKRQKSSKHIGYVNESVEQQEKNLELYLRSSFIKKRTFKKNMNLFSNFFLQPKKSINFEPINSINSFAGSYTRDPIGILKEMECLKKESDLEELKKIFIDLKASLPKDYKMGSAVKNGDSFFDAVAQRLNELKTDIVSIKPFNVITLREDCANYADNHKDKIIKDAERGGYFFALQGPFGPIQCVETKQDMRDDDKTFKIYLEKVKITSAELSDAINGRPEIEGEIICEKYGIKLKVIDVMKGGVNSSHITTNEIGNGNIMIYVINYCNHFIPLLADIKNDVEESEDVSRKKIYGKLSHLSKDMLSKIFDYFECKKDKKKILKRTPEERQVTDMSDKIQADTDRQQMTSVRDVKLLSEREPKEQDTGVRDRTSDGETVDQRDRALRDERQMLDKETDQDSYEDHFGLKQALHHIVCKKRRTCNGNDTKQPSPSNARKEIERSSSDNCGRTFCYIRQDSDSESGEQREGRILNEQERLLKNSQLFCALLKNKDSEEKLKKVEKHLNEGADVNARDANYKKNTPLHIAVLKGELEIVKLLLCRGAHLSIKNDEWKTPLDIAKVLDIANKPKIVDVLEGHIYTWLTKNMPYVFC